MFDALGPVATALIAGALATLLALYIAPIVIRAAKKYGIVDKPSTELKTHREPVPYLGGVIIFVAVLLSLSFALTFDARALAILLCASIVVSLGLVDDLGTLVPRDKLIGQVVAAFMLVRTGVHIELAAWPTPVDEVITVLWLVTCMNAFNILDVSDGLAATAGIVGAVGVGALAIFSDDLLLFTLATTVGGATLGFFWFNRQPARIYLGDTGSMLLGALLGSMVMLSRFSDTNDFAPFIAPLALLALPLFDLTLVIVARLHARRPIWFGSPDHFAVRLRDHGHPASRIASGAGAMGLVFVTAGVASTRLPLLWAALVLGLLVLFGFTLLGWILWRWPSRASPRFAPSLPAAAQPDAGALERTSRS